MTYTYILYIDKPTTRWFHLKPLSLSLKPNAQPTGLEAFKRSPQKVDELDPTLVALRERWEHLMRQEVMDLTTEEAQRPVGLLLVGGKP